MLRRIAEKLSRNRAFKRYLPAQFSKTPLLISPDSQLKYLKPGIEAFDKDLLRLALEHISAGSHVWDIGANVGVFTFAAASLAGSTGEVLSVEPDVWLASLLNRAAKFPENASLNINILPVAIASEPGIATFHIAARGRASNALASVGQRENMGGVREKHFVPISTLDELLKIATPPDFVKIDVEGAELMVLQGAQKLLTEIRPIIYCEIGAEQKSDMITTLHKADYQLFDPNLPLYERFEQEICSFNTLAYPRERVAEQKQLLQQRASISLAI